MQHQFCPLACQYVAEVSGITESFSWWSEARQGRMMNHDGAVIALGFQVMQKSGQDLKLFGAKGACQP